MFVVIGWREDVSNGRVVPVAAPLGRFGKPRTIHGDLAYLAEAPIPGPIAIPRPADAETEVIRMDGPVWPDPNARPGY
jgi:hypothetical protein